MNTLDLSIEQRVDAVNEIAGKVLYESNPNRVGWESHGVNIYGEYELKDNIPTDKYYLYQCYSHLLQEADLTILWEIYDFFGTWVETFLTGRTSISNMLNVYTIENLEEKLSIYEPVVNRAWEIRLNWIESNSK